MGTLPAVAVVGRLLADLDTRGVSVTLNGDTLRIRALRGAIGTDDRVALAAHKAEIVALLAGGQGSAGTAPDPADLAQAEGEYERLYWGRIIPLGNARRAAIERGDHAEAARLDAEKGALAEGDYTDARRRYLALIVTSTTAGDQSRIERNATYRRSCRPLGSANTQQGGDPR